MILNPNKTRALVVSRSRTVNPPLGDLVLSGVSTCASSNLDILGTKFDGKFTFEDHVRGIVSRVSERIGVLRLAKHIFVDTCWICFSYYIAIALLFVFILPILEYCFPVWVSAAECYLQLLESQVCSVARLWHDQSFLSLCRRRSVAWLSMLYKVNANSASFESICFPLSFTYRAAAAAHPLEFEVSRCRTSQIARSFQAAKVRMRDNLSYTVFDTETLDWFKSVVNRWLLPWVVFSSVFRSAGACGLAKAVYKQLSFSRLGLCCWF